jgi:hypothetical protein
MCTVSAPLQCRPFDAKSEQHASAVTGQGRFSRGILLLLPCGPNHCQRWPHHRLDQGWEPCGSPCNASVCHCCPLLQMRLTASLLSHRLRKPWGSGLRPSSAAVSCAEAAGHGGTGDNCWRSLSASQRCLQPNQEQLLAFPTGLQVRVLINDTLGVMAAGRYMNPDAMIGIILGTGRPL